MPGLPPADDVPFPPARTPSRKRYAESHGARVGCTRQLLDLPEQIYCSHRGAFTVGLMATAAKLAIAEDALSAAEEYALLTGEEIFAASRETSRQYNGIVLAKAVVIVQTRLRCSSLAELGRRLGISRTMICRHAAAQ